MTKKLHYLDQIAAAAAERADLDARIAELAHTARQEGATWADIAAELGVSRQAAHQRFGEALETC